MEPITMFKAFDGTVFSTAEKAIEHEKIVLRVAEIMKPLGNNNIKGKSFIQHDPKVFQKVKTEFVKFAAQIIGDKYIEQKAEKVHRHGVFGRILDDGGGMLGLAWVKLMCFDSLGREYEQPYYAIQAEKKISGC